MRRVSTSESCGEDLGEQEPAEVGVLHMLSLWLCPLRDYIYLHVYLPISLPSRPLRFT